MLRNKNVVGKDSSQSKGILNYKQKCKAVQKHNKHFVNIGLLSLGHTPYTIHVSPE